MNKLLVSIPLVFSFIHINSVFANSMDVPMNCGLEPSTFSYNPLNISSAINSGSALYQNEADYLDWAFLFTAVSSTYSSSTMSTEGPDYVLQGVPTRFKYDGSWFDWTSRWFTVRFGTSEFGSKVTKTSNFDNNAYTDLTFNYTHGPGLVWSKGDGCMTKTVLVQYPPTASLKKLHSANTAGSPINAEVNFTIDEHYSYAAVNNSPVTFTWTFDNKDLSGVIETRITTTPYVSHSPQYSGDYRVSVSVNDGTYSDLVILGLVDFTTPGSGGRTEN